MKNVEDIYPLTPLQSGMLFHSLMAPESGVYANQLTCTLPADLDPRLFQQAWERLVERHGVLRTAFLWDGLEEPLQAVRKKVALPWRELDWRGLPAEERRRRFAELREGERHTPLPLAKAPLMRFSLLRLDGEFGFIWTFHHLLLDGWSLPLLLRELAVVYTALRAGREPQGPALPPVRPFSDYVVWLQKQDPARAEPFWRRELAGVAAPTSLDLPGPAPAAVAAGAAGSGEHRTRLSREATAGLQALAARHKLTLQTVTLGAWAVLLGRYGNTGEVVFGSVASGRPAELPGVEAMVGLFVNTLPVRVRVDGAEPLAPWLQRLQQRQLARQDFEHTPLTQIQGWSEVPAGSPLFETLYAFENYPEAGTGESAGLRLENLRSYETTNYPVTVTLQAGEQLALQLLYDRSRVDGGATLRLLGHFGTLLAGLAENLDRERRLDDLSLLTAAEARQLAAWNDTARDYPQATIHELFAEQAERSPDAVAVTCAGRETGRELSYGEVHRRALGLAGRLRRAGVGPGSPVGLCAESLPEMVVGMLGILLAGGSYVPLDLAYPPERLAFLLEDTGAAVLVAEEGLAGRLPAGDRPVLDLNLFPQILRSARDDGQRASAGGPVYRGGQGIHPDNPAYVIYTSGSTGRPKGVVVPHRAVVRLVRGTDYVQLGPDDRMAQASNPSFDAATFEIWGALLNGGRLVGLPRNTVLSPELLTAALRREGITTLFLTTALFNQVAREVPGGFAPLRTLLFGGEAVDAAAVRAVLREGPPALLLHVYGPTETTTFATWQQVTEVPEDAVPIGRPLANGTFHVLSAVLHPQPAGAPGELYLGGDGLSLGYHARPELTAERFVPDPFGPRFGGRPGGRLYRTGDLVRQRPDGAVEFLRRLDSQVKIRGFRIEPGEIEAALLALPEVRQAAVVVREGGPGDRRLVACLAGETSAEAARAALRERLPDYMMPSAFVALEALPLNPSGKVDRRALAALRLEETRVEEAGAEPRTPYEETVATVFASVLNVERVGIRDDFFELGGHSLLATQVASRLRAELAVDLPLRAVFENPTVAALAREAETAARAGRGLSLPPIVPVARVDEAPLSFAQEWMWFVDQLDPTGASPVSLLAVRLQGRLDGAALERALGEVTRRHEVLRTTFPVVAGRPVQKVAPPAPFPLPRVDLAALPEGVREAEADALLAAEVRRRLDLEHGPLMRGLLTALGPEDHLLILPLHHILVDGWSMGLLTRELAALYAAYRRGEGSPLPPLPVQYADFAVWQRESLLQGESLEALLAYWTERLAGDPPALELPGARQGEVATLRSDRVPLALGEGLSASVRRLAREQGVTLYTVLLAAFQALLHRTTRQTDIRVGSSIANRNRPEVEDLVGYFVNTLVMRGDLAGDPAFLDLLGQLKEVVLGAYAHQDLPFTKLVEALRPDRAAGRTPLFQVMLILQNTPVRPLEVPGGGLTLTPVESQVEIATFDLTLVLSDGGAGDDLAGWLWFNRDLLDPAAAAHLGERFRLLLEGAAADPGKRLSEISLLTEAERRQLLAGRRAEEREEGEGREDTLRVRLERRAQEDPEAVALVVRGEEIPYGELLDRAEELGLFAGGPEAETVRSLDRLGEEHRFDDRDVWARLHGRNGLAALETWGALLHGGRLVVPAEPARGAAEVVDLIRKEGVTVLVLSPEDFGGLARSGAAPKDLRSLRSVILAGAEPEATDLQAWRERYGDRRPRLARIEPSPA